MKFMAIPNYTYLKLKMPGPGGVITVSTSFQHAYECEVKCCDHATTIVTSEEVADIRKEVIEEATDPKRSTKSFELVEGSKEVLIDPDSSEGKTVALVPCFPLNRNACSLTSSMTTKTSLCGNPQIC